jgi:hypothetical protein
LKEAETNLPIKGRFVDFRHAFTVDNQTVFKYLHYFRSMQNIFDLEYFRHKLSTRSNSMAQLELAVFSGLPFWEATFEVPTNDDTAADDVK